MDGNTQRRRRILIGVSPRILRQVPTELGFRGKTLQYLEQSVAQWVMTAGAMVVMIPAVQEGGLVKRSDLSVHDYAATLDGLILQGGADIDPAIYGEDPSPALGVTDPVRDRFELDLLRAFVEYGKPVLGICRGMQLINVAFGGTLHQDLTTGGATTYSHYLRELYDEHAHALRFREDGWLKSLYPDLDNPQVNSIHHQGVKVVGRGLTIDAWSEDGVVECIRGESESFLVGVQWHPEFHDERFPNLLPAQPLLDAFIQAAKAKRMGPGSR
jgi:putative glutamine amidotransferase